MKSWFERLWSEERRQAERRASLPLQAYYWDGATPTPRQVRDISPEGMYLVTDQRWYPNTLISMTLARTDKTEADPGRAIMLMARVVRSGTDGVGMAFVLPRSKRSSKAENPLSHEADRKELIEFLPKLESDIGHSARKKVSRLAWVPYWTVKVVKFEEPKVGLKTALGRRSTPAMRLA